MNDFDIVDKDAEIDTCYGHEKFCITIEEIVAILSGKRLYSTVNCGEYAITIEMAESEVQDADIIDIPDENIPKQQDTMSVNLTFMDGKLCECDYPFDVVENSDDCVNRQAVEDAIAETNVNGESLGYTVAWDILSDLPPVTPQPKAGHWIDHDHNGIGYIECSECGRLFLSCEMLCRSYCPNCGTKMQNKELKEGG